MEEGKSRVKRRKKNKIKHKQGFYALSLFFLFLLFCFFCFQVLNVIGKNSLKRHAEKVLEQEIYTELTDAKQDDLETPLELEEGQILVDGEVYEYNEDIITFLCMGIDSHSGISKNKTPGKAGQADAIILVVVDSRAEKIQIINVNRDSIVDIELYDTAGIYVGNEKGQITLQYAYGNGREKSCQLMERVVSELFYGIPIHGYVAMDILAIAELNDAVGGVDVTATEDVVVYMPQWIVGSKVKLEGEEALYYVRHRAAETQELGTNLRRIDRQKEFMISFMEKVKEKTKENISFPLKLYNKVQKNIVTSISIEELTYLVNSMLGYDFSISNMLSVQGKSVMGTENEEFYVDDEKLKQMVIDVFYDKIQ